MLEGSIPEHGGEAGSAILKFWGTFFPMVGLVLLVGSILLLLTTNVGFRRAFQVSAACFTGYLFLHSLTWILSGNGPRTQPTATDYIGTRIIGTVIGMVCLVIFGFLVYSMHTAERRAQHVTD